jgi:glycerol-3-phosphate dehydrogenase subunit C
MAAIKIEYLARRNALLGVPRRDRLFASLPRWLIRRRNRSPSLARQWEQWFAISAKRRLPEPAPRAEALGERDIYLFIDTFARHFDPEIAEAAHAVLTAAVYVVRVLAPAGDDSKGGRPLSNHAKLILCLLPKPSRSACTSVFN